MKSQARFVGWIFTGSRLSRFGSYATWWHIAST
jgi:hypothetical protein